MTLFLPLFFMMKEKCYFLVDCSYHVSLAFDLEPVLWLLGWLVYFFSPDLDKWHLKIHTQAIHVPQIRCVQHFHSTPGFTHFVGEWHSIGFLSVLHIRHTEWCLLSLSFVITCISLRRYLDFCKYLVSHQIYVQF